jgi:glycerol-3-phosphate dehydrogenase
MVCGGYHLLSDYAAATGIPVERTGALLVAWNDEELAALPALQTKAADNGYTKCDIVDSDEVYRQVPNLGEGALGGLTVPDESIICTWTTNLALATDAVARGAALHTGTRTERVTLQPDRTVLQPRAATSSPAGSSTPPAWVPTTWMRRLAITDSTSHRAAANCSSTTSWPAP